MKIFLFIAASVIILYGLIALIFRKPLKYHNLGIKKYNQKNYEAAIEYFNKAIQINPLNANPYLYRGYSKSKLNDFHGAIDDYTLAMKRKKPTADDYINRGGLKDQLEDYDGAIEDYTQATYINEKDSDAYFNRGLSNAKKGFIHAAILDWKIAADFGNIRALEKLKEIGE